MSKRKAVSDFKRYYSILFECAVDKGTVNLIWSDYVDNLHKSGQIDAAVDWKCPVKGK